MLFDLRGRGRRRVVQTIYLGLALLMGVGLVGFGIGGGFGSGGLFNAVNNNNGSSGASFSGQISNDQKLTTRQPTNPAAWATLTRDLYLQAGTGENYNQITGVFTSKGQLVLGRAAQAWQRYLTLNPSHPSPDLANLMYNAYSPAGLGQPTQAMQALQIVITARPNDQTLYEDLAIAAYQAHDAREGDLASAKAVSLAPASQRAQLKAQLAALKANPTGAAAAPPAAGAATTTIPSSALGASSTTSTTSSAVPAKK